MFIRSLAPIIVATLAACGAAAEPDVVVRAASVDGTKASFDVEVDGVAHVVYVDHGGEAVVAAVHDANNERECAALERDGEVRHFDAELNLQTEPADDATAMLVDLALADELSTDAPPRIEWRRIMLDCEKEGSVSPCAGDAWYLCGNC